MKKIYLPLLFILVSLATYSQVEYMHQLGGKYYLYGNAGGHTGTGFLYSFRMNIFRSYKTSFSVGTHFGMGFSRRPGKGSSLLADIPLVAEFNTGYGAAKNIQKGLGAYIGLGYALHKVNTLPDVYGRSWLQGPVITGGIRFKFTGVAPLSLGGSYMFYTRSNAAATNIFGISLSYMFGLDK